MGRSCSRVSWYSGGYVQSSKCGVGNWKFLTVPASLNGTEGVERVGSHGTQLFARELVLRRIRPILEVRRGELEILDGARQLDRHRRRRASWEPWDAVVRA